MNNKDDGSNSDQIQELVIFRSKEKKTPSRKEGTSFENSDPESKIKIIYQIKPFGGKYLYSVLLLNQSNAPITEVKVKIKYPEFLTISRCTPPTISAEEPDIEEKGMKQINLGYDELKEYDKRQINLYFTPITLNNTGTINTYITFVNSKDYVRLLSSDPIEIKNEPPAFEPKDIPSDYIGEFVQNPQIKKAIKSIGVGIEKQKNPDLYFDHIEQILRFHKFKLIAREEKKQIAWYFGTELESKKDVLVVGQVVSNKVEWLVSSQQPSILVPLLTMFSNDFKKRLISIGLIDSVNKFYDLECKYCGTVLPHFPEKGKPVECKNCKYEQFVW
ncbi:MAG: hypothetical protein ACTSRI_08965 [Promethearchaeota archaeon]